MAEQMNIYQKLARIRKQVEVIQKNKSGYGYKYVSEDEILAKISVFMDKYGLSLIPNMHKKHITIFRVNCYGNITCLIIIYNFYLCLSIEFF